MNNFAYLSTNWIIKIKSWWFQIYVWLQNFENAKSNFFWDVTCSMAVLLQVSQFKSKLGGGGEGVDYKDVIKFYKL